MLVSSMSQIGVNSMRLIFRNFLPLHHLITHFSTAFILFWVLNPSSLQFLFVIVSVITSPILITYITERRVFLISEDMEQLRVRKISCF